MDFCRDSGYTTSIWKSNKNVGGSMNDVQVYIAVSNIITKWCLNCKDYECTKHLSDKQK